MTRSILKLFALGLPCIIGQAIAADVDPSDIETLISEKVSVEKRIEVIQGQLLGLNTDEVDTSIVNERLASLQQQLQDVSSQLSQAKKLLIRPEYVKALGEVESGYNNSNPTWTSDGKFLGFERHDDRNKEIIIADKTGNIVQTVKYQSDDSDDLGLDLLLPEFEDNVSYNAGLSWSPDSSQFIFMSNGSESNYDLYLGYLGDKKSTRLTKHGEKDGHAHWSPTGKSIAFVSGRSGSANVYLYDTASSKIRQISNHKQSFLYPQWSPHGDRLAVIRGSNENHNIYVYENLTERNGSISHRALVSWDYDDLRPIWSPDGSKVAFYTNYNEENDPKVWSIAVINADSKELKHPQDIIPLIVATNVIPDVDKGPAWMPGSNHIVYVKNNRKRYNPIQLVDINSKTSKLIVTDTKINHDISCSPDGLIAFRSQVDQWDQIFITKLSIDKNKGWL